MNNRECLARDLASRVEYTHPDVLAAATAGAGWADPIKDPTRIDWGERQRRAAIPFVVVDGRPVNPCETTRVRYGRNELGHWGEQLCADALVVGLDSTGRRWIVMVERADGHGWALPGGYVDPGEDPATAAVRELAEETGLRLPAATWALSVPRYVPDPRGSDESWMVTVLASTRVGPCAREDFPTPVGADDARRAVWVRADSYQDLTRWLADTYQGRVFAAHRVMLTAALDTEVEVTPVTRSPDEIYQDLLALDRESDLVHAQPEPWAGLSQLYDRRSRLWEEMHRVLAGDLNLPVWVVRAVGEASLGAQSIRWDYQRSAR